MGKLKRLAIGLLVAALTLAGGIGAAVYMKRRAQSREVTKQQSLPRQAEGELVTDERFFARGVALPTGEVTNEQRISFARALESVIDEAKTGLKEIEFRAEAPDKDVLALYAYNVTRESCRSLLESNVIQRAAESGFRTFSCQDKQTNYLYTTPIKGSRGEIRIGP